MMTNLFALQQSEESFVTKFPLSWTVEPNRRNNMTQLPIGGATGCPPYFMVKKQG